MFGHSEGYGTSLPIKYPIQPKLGVFSETALQRYDFAVYAAGKVFRQSCIANALPALSCFLIRKAPNASAPLRFCSLYLILWCDIRCSTRNISFSQLAAFFPAYRLASG